MSIVQIFQDHELSRPLVHSMLAMEDRVWPSGRPIETSVENFYRYQATQPPQLLRYLVIEQGEVLAQACTFLRVMKTEQGEQAVMALSGVCTDPDHRGRGFGAAVVRAAFARVDDGTFPVSIFQTPVEVFYAKLGAGLCVNNRWVDRTNQKEPDGYPWEAQEKIMHYPAGFAWPEGLIDINGEMY